MCGKTSEAREPAMVVTHRNPDGTPKVWCDPCLEPLIKALNDAGVETVASCCGHDSGLPGWIMLADGRDIVIMADHEQTLALEAGWKVAQADRIEKLQADLHKSFWSMSAALTRAKQAERERDELRAELARVTPPADRHDRGCAAGISSARCQCPTTPVRGIEEDS